MDRFYQYCRTQSIGVNKRVDLFLNTVDETSFKVINLELTDREKAGYPFVKQYPLQRFDI